jgi:RHS repeat-associated protein
MNYTSLQRFTAKVLGSSLLMILAASAFAQNDNPTGKSGVFNGNSDIGVSYDPYTANTTRTIVDLTVPGAVGSYPLQWTRTMNSRLTEGPSYAFGQGGAWQHSYKWDIDWEPATGSESWYLLLGNHFPQPKAYIVYYPDGRRVDFQRRTTVPADPLYRGPAGVTDRFQPVAGTGICYLLLSDGGKIEFQQDGYFNPDAGTGWDFHLYAIGIIDPYGQKTTLSNVGPGIGQVTEPGGRWLKIYYISGTFLISSVEAGYGANTVTQSVTYSYQQFLAGSFSYTTLTGASYSDGTAAAYTYQQANTYPNTGPPLIQTCDDVRHPGPMKKIAYDFVSHSSEANGGIYGEFAIARKWLHPAPFVVSYLLATHTEHRGDGPGRVFYYGPVAAKPLCVPQPYLLSSYTDFQTESTEFCYDANTYLTSVTDAKGNTTTFTKTPLTGKILTITHPPDQTGVSSTKQFFYTNPNTAYYLDHEINELGHRTGYIRDDKLRIKTINYPDTASEEFTYNGRGQVLTHKMTSGGTEAFEYDFRGRLERYRDAYHTTGKPTAWYQYDPLDRVSGVTDWRGTGPGDLNYTTNYDYNQRGQLTKQTHPIDPVTGARYFFEYVYNNDSTLAAQTDQRGNTTSYGYDDYKRLSSTTAPLAFAGDPTPRVTYLHYNKDGSATIDYRFTAAAVANVTTPSGRTEKTLYDGNFRKSSVTIGTGTEAATTSYGYDAVGNLVGEREPNHPNNVSTEYFYDNRNRLTDMNDAMVSGAHNSLGHSVSWTYDQIGNKKTQLRANDQLITYDQYDPMNRLQIQSVQHDVGVIDRTIMTYDLAGNLRTFTDARQKQYIYGHDLLNRRTMLTYPSDDGGVTREEHYHYDLASNMDTYTNRAGVVQTFQYDNRNRRTHYSWSDGSRSQWTVYDPVGNVTNVNNGVDVVESVYDWRNRKTSETQIAGIGVRWTVGYSYDADSNRLTLTHPAGHYFTNYYNTRNQLQFVDDNLGRLVTYAYDLSGNRTSRTLRNGTSTTYVPDFLNRPISVDHRRAATSFARFDYHFDKVSRIDWVKRGFRGDVYEYYLDDQLKTAQFDAYQPDVAPSSPANTTSLVYDASGNRVSQENGMGFDYTYTANDLNQYNLVREEGSAPRALVPAYDAKGNLGTYDQSVYTYDAHNRLMSASANGNFVSFFYDALGRQILRGGTNGQWIYSIWDGWDLIAEYNEQNVLLHSYVHGARSDEMVLRFNGGPTIWYHQDAQGNTTHLTDNAGNVVEQYKYDPALAGAPYFYNASGQQFAASAFNNRFLYTGRDWIKEVGLYDYRNRFYLPALGRFLQPDPIGFAGGDANLYRYCGGDPVNYIDPDGTTVRFVGDRRAINTAINYLNNSPTFANIFSTLQNSPHTYTVRTDYSFMNGSFNYLTGAIRWNPSLGLLVTSGEGIQSAAMILAHELAHAFDYDSNPTAYRTNREITLPGYDTMVEYIAVALETLIARELNEATRADHRGNFVRMSSPTAKYPELAAYLNSKSTPFVRFYLNGMLSFGPGWGRGSGLNPGSFGGASTASVAAAIFSTKFGTPGGGGQPGEGALMQYQQ